MSDDWTSVLLAHPVLSAFALPLLGVATAAEASESSAMVEQILAAGGDPNAVIAAWILTSISTPGVVALVALYALRLAANRNWQPTLLIRHAHAHAFDGPVSVAMTSSAPGALEPDTDSEGSDAT